MSIFPPALIMLALLLVVVFLLGTPANKAVKRAERELSEDDVKAFRETYFRASSRQNMPMKFETYAKAIDRAKIVWTVAILAIICGLLWAIIGGAGLGLFPYP